MSHLNANGCSDASAQPLGCEPTGQGNKEKKPRTPRGKSAEKMPQQCPEPAAVIPAACLKDGKPNTRKRRAPSEPNCPAKRSRKAAPKKRAMKKESCPKSSAKSAVKKRAASKRKAQADCKNGSKPKKSNARRKSAAKPKKEAKGARVRAMKAKKAAEC